jgi:hypothetical protein
MLPTRNVSPIQTDIFFNSRENVVTRRVTHLRQQADFTGFEPMCSFSCATQLFLSPSQVPCKFALRDIHDRALHLNVVADMTIDWVHKLLQPNQYRS